VAESQVEPVLTRRNVALLAIAMVAMGTLSVVVGQDANWDFKNYHFYNGYAFLAGRFDYDIQPGQMQSFLNPTLDAATYLIVEHAPPEAVGFTLGAIQGVNLWLLFIIAHTTLLGLEPRTLFVTALACALLGVSGAMGVAELGTVFHDLTTAAFVLAAVLISLRGQSASGGRHSFIIGSAVAGGLLGLGAGLKYTLALYAVAGVVATFAAGRSWKERVFGAGAFGIATAVGMATTAGHWMFRLVVRFGIALFRLLL
jgi:hypothetical protein